MKTIQELLCDGKVSIGELYEDDKDILVIEDYAGLSEKEARLVEEYAVQEDLEVFYSDDVIYIDEYYYLKDSNNYFFTNKGYPIGMQMLYNQDYDFQDDIIDTFKNQANKALPYEAYEWLDDEFKENGWELMDKTFWYGYESGKATYPKTVLEKYQKMGFDVIFILMSSDPFNVDYKVLLKKRA